MEKNGVHLRWLQISFILSLMSLSYLKSKAPKILHCPATIGFNAPMLSKIERSIGYDSVTLSFSDSVYGSKADVMVSIYGWKRLFNEWMRWLWLYRAKRDYDIIHFNFGCTLMPMTKNLPILNDVLHMKRALRYMYNIYASAFELKDLKTLKDAGKKIVVTFQGDDARQWDICRAECEFTHAKEVEPIYLRKEQDDAIRKRIREFDQYADIIYAVNPDLIRFLPQRAQYFPYATPDLAEWKFIGVEVDVERPLRVLHAPTHTDVKGTKYLELAINNLKAEGFLIDYVRIQNMDNQEARKHYENADVLVDQLLAGWFGGLSAELMALGKPVICYLRESDFRWLPPTMADEIPIINANPSTVEDVLRNVLFMSRKELHAVGVSSRAFISKWQGRDYIASRLREDYSSLFA